MNSCHELLGDQIDEKSKLVVLIGKPNVGKSALFNRLSGSNQKVTNYPGVTIDIKSAKKNGVTFVDFPGLYSLCPIVKDEQIALEKLLKFIQAEDTRATILVLLEGSRFQESLYLGLQIRKLAIKYGKPLIFVVTMLDELERNKDTIDAEGIEKVLSTPVVAVSSRNNKNINELLGKITQVSALSEEECKQYPVEANVHVQARELHQKYGPKSDVYVKRITRIDSFAMNRFIGGFIFLAVMTIFFQSIYTFSNPLIDIVDSSISFIGQWFGGKIENSILNSLVVDGVFGGLGAFLVFVPQIFIMFFVISFIEDSGYLARASYICHKPLKFFGMTGRSFYPLLSGYACAIPAVMGTRNIESPRARLLTMIAIPLMTCSARLPVYGLLVSALIPNQTVLYGLLGIQGLVFFILYISGLLLALIVTGLVDRIAFKDKSMDQPFVLELPPYRFPNLVSVFRGAYRSTRRFVEKAGVIIFVLTFIIWALSYFPMGAGHIRESYLGMMGQLIQKPMEWIGLDWIYGVAIIASFVAREVFVGTLGTIFGLAEVDEQSTGLIDKINDNGLSLASGLSLLVFYMIALQCTSTLAVLKQESGSYKIPVTLLICYTALAYILALGTFHLVQALTI